jgi:hypothetical protein
MLRVNPFKNEIGSLHHFDESSTLHSSTTPKLIALPADHAVCSADFLDTIYPDDERKSRKWPDFDQNCDWHCHNAAIESRI